MRRAQGCAVAAGSRLTADTTLIQTIGAAPSTCCTWALSRIRSLPAPADGGLSAGALT
jgi:hypothetical protein